MSVKRLKELSENDLTSNPVWRVWEQDEEEFVSVSNDKCISENSNHVYIVLTEFILNNRTRFTGFCSPQDPSGLDYIQPVLFTQNGQVNIYMDNGWDNKAKQDALRKIELTKDHVFPIEFETKIKCENRFYFGKILDFNIME
jgi:hypothetical protein